MTLEAQFTALQDTLNEFKENPAGNTGRIIDLAYEAKELAGAIRNLESETKDLMAEAISLGAKFCDEQGLDMARGSNAQLSFTESTYPSVEDWNQLYKYLDESNNYGILQRRLSAGVVLELVETGVKVPGITMSSKREPNLRKIRR